MLLLCSSPGLFFPRSGPAVFTLTFVSLRRGCSKTLLGCVPGCAGQEMHPRWCNFISFLCLGDSFLRTCNSSGLKNYIGSTIYCAVENRPQEIVFSQLTPPIGKAKVTSTCAAVPFGEVRSHSRVPVYRPRAAKKSGRTSQPLAMLCATRSDLRAARGPLQPIGCRLFRSAGVNDRQSRFSRIESVDRRGGRTGLNRVCVRLFVAVRGCVV